MTSMLDELDSIPEEKHMEICRKADELQKQNLRGGRMTEHKVGQPSEEEVEKQLKRYGVEE